MCNRAITKIYAAIILAIILASAAGITFLAAGSRPEASSDPVLFVDMAGRDVKIPAVVNRVIIMQSYWTEIACTIGAAHKIVGIGKDITTSVFIPSNVKNQTNVGSLFSGVNLETIVALKPDVVITDYGYGKAGEIIKALESLNISVVCLFAQSFDDQLSATKIIGRVLNCEQRANELVSYLSSAHSGITFTASSIPESAKPKVLICNLDVWGQGLVYAYANSSWGRTVVDVGGTNVALEEFPEMSWSKVNFEKVLSWDPDIIVILGRENATLMTQLSSLNGTSWGQLDAVKEGKLYGMLIGAKDIDAFFDWTPRMLIGEMQLASYLQPAYFGNLDIHSAADALFLRYYNISHVQQP